MEKIQVVLVVDDEPCIRESVSKILEKIGYKVISCANRQEAIVAAGKNELDLILTDFAIGNGVYGDTLLQELRKIKNDQIPAILMTGSAKDLGFVERIRNIGISILEKPFLINELLIAVAQACHATAAST